MKTLIILCLTVLLTALPVWAQDLLTEEPHPLDSLLVDEPDVTETEPSDPVIPEDPAEPGDDLEVPDEEDEADVEKELNASQLERVKRLAEASGHTEDVILALRNGGSLEGLETEDGTVAVRGWGLVAKMLELPPGVLGHGTGDKFYPKDDVIDDLPELPELDEDAVEAVRSAREQAVERKSERRTADVHDRVAKVDRKVVREKSTKRANVNRPEKPEKVKKETPRQGKGHRK